MMLTARLLTVVLGGLPSLPEPAYDAAISTPTTSSAFYPPATTGDAITIVGGTYQLNGAGGFVSTEITYTDNDYFELRGTSSGEYETPVSVVLTIGGVDYTFVITTIAEPPTVDAALRESGSAWLREDGTPIYREG